MVGSNVLMYLCTPNWQEESIDSCFGGVETSKVSPVSPGPFFQVLSQCLVRWMGGPVGVKDLGDKGLRHGDWRKYMTRLSFLKHHSMKFLELVTSEEKPARRFLGSPDRELKTSSVRLGLVAMFACCGCTAGEPELAGPAPTKATEADEEENTPLSQGMIFWKEMISAGNGYT